MAKDKKSFLLYADNIHIVRHLNDNQAGKLLKHILEYVNDLHPKPLEDGMVNLAFEPIKLSLKRDLAKYESIRKRNAENGKKGGRPPEPKKPTGLNGNPKEPKKADSDSDSDNGSDIVKEKHTHEQKLDWFKQQVKETKIFNSGKYPDKMFIHFTEYWTAKKPNGTKMAYEMQKTFSFQARLMTWINNDNEYKKL